jgi:predicted nicotinamide N-methyase
MLMQYYIGHTSKGQVLMAGRRCLELGSGVGAVSIAAVRLGASKASAMEDSELLAALANLNAHNNLDAAQVHAPLLVHSAAQSSCGTY